MTTVTQNDASDLLILDDTPAATNAEEAPILEEENNISDELITFDEPTEESPTMEVKEEAPVEEASLDMGLDLGVSTEETPTMEVKEEAPAEEASLDMGLDLGLSTEEAPTMEVKEEASLEIETEKGTELDLGHTTDFDLEQVTANFIEQLEYRKSQIATNVEMLETNISMTEEKMNDLKEKIEEDRKGIEKLNSENSEIDYRISLVSGKSKAEDIKTSTSTRVHNAKRKKAA